MSVRFCPFSHEVAAERSPAFQGRGAKRRPARRGLKPSATLSRHYVTHTALVGSEGSQLIPNQWRQLLILKTGQQMFDQTITHRYRYRVCPLPNGADAA